MAIGKWIGGFMGFISGGPLGALAGFALGALFDVGIDKVNEADINAENYQNNAQRNAYSQQQRARNRYQEAQGQRNSFLFSLLVLASYIIRADGKVMHSEMEMLRNFLRSNFGSIAVQQGEQIILQLFEQQKKVGSERFQHTIRESCMQIAANMDDSQRLQLLNFLAMLVKADGKVVESELTALRNVALWLGLNTAEADSMLNLRKDDLASAYQVLGVPPTAGDDEVKAAYRKKALQHHPDRVATLGEDVKKAAEKKFQEINDAKERIYQARGL